MSLRILIADDEAGFAEVLKDRLSRSGAAIDVVYDGRRAISMIERNSYDIVFVDHNMPELTGLEVIRHIRNKGIKSKTVMITAYEEIEGSLVKAVGADGYLTKPVKLEDVDRFVGLWYNDTNKTEKK